MNNFKKYTKNELIRKLQSETSNLNNKQNNLFLIKIKNYFSQLWNLLTIIKDILAKLTFITIIIKIIKRYSIFRKLWRILNSIVMSIFGLSLIDNFGFDFINNFLSEFKIIIHNTIDYLSDTKFYNYLNKFFFNNKTESDNSSRSIQKTMSEQYSSNESKIGENKGNSKISEWLKPDEDIKEDIKKNETSYKKYFIIAGVIISASLIWHYSDEIITGAIDLYNRFRGDASGGEGGDASITKRDNQTNISTSINTEHNTPIELVDKGKNKILTSPSLENLNNQVEESWSETPSSPKSSGSDSSNSSTETITPQTFASSSSSSSFESEALQGYKKFFGIKPEESFLSSLVKDNWKNYVKSDIRESINYIESHLPKNEFDDTTVINNMLNEVNEYNINYSREIKHNIDNWSLDVSKLATETSKETLNWIDKMRKEINKFD